MYVVSPRFAHGPRTKAAAPMSGLNAPAQPLDPRGDTVIPIGLARELGDLFGAKVVQSRKLNGSHAVRPAPGSRWDEKVEQVEAPVAPMLL